MEEGNGKQQSPGGVCSSFKHGSSVSVSSVQAALHGIWLSCASHNHSHSLTNSRAHTSPDQHIRADNPSGNHIPDSQKQRGLEHRNWRADSFIRMRVPSMIRLAFLSICLVLPWEPLGVLREVPVSILPGR